MKVLVLHRDKIYFILSTYRMRLIQELYSESLRNIACANKRRKDKKQALLMLYYTGSAQNLGETNLDSWWCYYYWHLSLIVCSEIISLLRSIPQEAENLQTIIQVRSMDVVGGWRAGDFLPLSAVGSPLWWLLFPDLSAQLFPTRSLMDSSWVLFMPSLPFGW